MTAGVKRFIEENIELLDREDFQEFEARAGMQTSDAGYDKGELHEILLRAGINPLPYISYVPFAFLRHTFIEGSFTVPGNCIDLGSRAFYSCSLSEIIIEEGVETISSLAFARSYKLEKIKFPSTLHTLDNVLFVGCDNLKEIIYNGTYEDFQKLYTPNSNPQPWFGTITTLLKTSCILKCKDQDINLRINYD